MLLVGLIPVPVLEAASAEVGSIVNNVIMTRNADMILVLSVFKVGSSLLSVAPRTGRVD